MHRLVRGVSAASATGALALSALFLPPLHLANATGGPASATAAAAVERLPETAGDVVAAQPGHQVADLLTPKKRPVRRVSRATVRVALSPKDIARAMVLRRGWSETQWLCLDRLWTRESNWQVHETEPSSGAYGIPQALPASKMASAGPDWRDDATTQITWGLGYIAERYGSPCAALQHSDEYNFY